MSSRGEIEPGCEVQPAGIQTLRQDKLEKARGVLGGLLGYAFFREAEVFRGAAQVVEDIGGDVGLTERLHGRNIGAVGFEEEMIGVDPREGFGALVVFFVRERAAHGEAHAVADEGFSDFHAAGEGVDNAAAFGCAVPLENLQHFIECAAAMQDHGQIEFFCDAHLRFE